MQRKDEMTIVVTFLMGLVAGFYFYLTGFAPQVEKVRQEVFTSDETEARSLLIEARQYGGCERRQGCASFLVRGDGSYSYLAGSALAGVTPESGTLSRSLRQQISQHITPQKIALAEVARESDTCDSYVDGIDLAYSITIDNVLYYIDTCTTELVNNPAVETTLLNIWNEVAN